MFLCDQRSFFQVVCFVLVLMQFRRSRNCFGEMAAALHRHQSLRRHGLETAGRGVFSRAAVWDDVNDGEGHGGVSKSRKLTWGS